MYKDLSALIVEKGYQIIKAFLHGIHTIRKLSGILFTVREKDYNKNISSN